MTKEERHLWYDFLREYSVKFTRQKVLGKYIADFYCAKANIVVELDGSQHYEDEGLLRQIPEITGVDIEYREVVNTVKALNMQGLSLPIHTTFFYKPESYSAEVVATDENDVPVFFKHSYGKGFVYFLTLPLEAYLTNKNGAFFKDDAPDYSCIYRELAQSAKIKRVCDSDNKFVRLTEHTIDENSLYVVAINYNNKTEVANISVEEGYRVITLYGEEVTDLKITMENNDGIIFKLEKDI